MTWPKQEIVVNRRRAQAPLVKGRQRLTVFVERTVLEVSASDGLSYGPLPFIAKQEDQSVAVEATGGRARMTALQVY